MVNGFGMHFYEMLLLKMIRSGRSECLPFGSGDLNYRCERSDGTYK